MSRESIDKIKEAVSIYTLFDNGSPRIYYDTKEKPCQINCPFHGADLGPSARVFPETNSMYCWACDRSWDVLDFWAEINGWIKDDGSLDIGRAIKDLADRFDIANYKQDWHIELNKSLDSIDGRVKGYAGLPMKDREDAKDSYSWMISRVMKIPSESRVDRWEEVKNVWDTLDSVDLHADSWKSDLKKWMIASRRLHISNSV
jgi:hypothetical protein